MFSKLPGVFWTKSSHWRCSLKIGVYKNFSNLKGKVLCWSLFLIKFQAFRPQAKLLRTPILKNICERLPLSICLMFNLRVLSREIVVRLWLLQLQIRNSNLFRNTSVKNKFFFISIIVTIFERTDLYSVTKSYISANILNILILKRSNKAIETMQWSTSRKI